MKHNKSEFIV